MRKIIFILLMMCSPAFAQNPGIIMIGTAAPNDLPVFVNNFAVKDSGVNIGTSIFTQGSVVFAGVNGAYSQNNAKFFWDNTNFRLGIGSSTPTANIDIQSGIITTNVPAVSIRQTWNASGMVFDAPLFINVTNTASSASSNLADFQVGGSSKFSFQENGQFTAAGNIASTTGLFIFNNTASTFLRAKAPQSFVFGGADAAAPAAQTIGVQNVSAGTSNVAGQNLTITGSQGTGTGAGGSIIFQTAPAGTTGGAVNALVTAMTITSMSGINVVGTYGIAKQAGVPSVAAGAGNCYLYAVAGTNSGSGKLQIMCGTSTTPVTIVDNIGAGF